MNDTTHELDYTREEEILPYTVPMSSWELRLIQ
jgi:hypothetical protein